MAESDNISPRVVPTAKAVPREVSVSRAEVLPTLRKHGSPLQAVKPSLGDVLCRCVGSGNDLIHQASPAPLANCRILL